MRYFMLLYLLLAYPARKLGNFKPLLNNLKQALDVLSREVALLRTLNELKLSIDHQNASFLLFRLVLVEKNNGCWNGCTIE